MPNEQSNGTGARRAETEFPTNDKGKEVKPMHHHYGTKVITIRKTITKTIKIESKPLKADKKLTETKKRTTTPQTVVVLHAEATTH